MSIIGGSDGPTACIYSRKTGNVLLLLSYWVIWILYFHKQSFGKQITLAILPICLFLLSGITMRHCLLILFGLVFGVGHVYVTYKNRIE